MLNRETGDATKKTYTQRKKKVECFCLVKAKQVPQTKACIYIVFKQKTKDNNDTTATFSQIHCLDIIWNSAYHNNGGGPECDQHNLKPFVCVVRQDTAGTAQTP